MRLRRRLTPLLVASLIMVAVVIILAYHYLLCFEAVLKASRSAKDLVNNFRLLYLDVLGLGTAFGLLLLFIPIIFKKQWVLYVCIILSSIVLLLTLFILSHKIPIEMMYQAELAKYRYLVSCCRNGSVNCVWGFIKTVADEFNATYATSAPKPQQLLKMPFVDIDEVSKLATIAKTGACADFALGVTKVLNDLGCAVRIVGVKGVDHAVPEVMIGNKWYVVDALYTTPNQPVEASQWARYLAEYKPECFNAIAKLIDMNTGMDITAEHGFNTSLVTIEAIIDPTAKKGDEKPAKEARILIFIPSNRGLYRTLVYLGKTNEEGLATVELVAGHDYIVFVEQEGLVGVEYIYIPQGAKFFKITIPMYAERARIVIGETSTAQIPQILVHLCSGAVGGIVVLLLKEFIEHRKKPVLEVNQLDFQRFERSVRLYLIVENKSKQVARNATAYLTIALYKDDERAVDLPGELLPSKEWIQVPTSLGSISLEVPKSWDYLVPKSNNFRIVKEPLPWAVPKQFGKGLDGDAYQHVTDIPASGINKVVLMDVYRVGNQCYVLRVFSEYGTEVKPRAVLVLPPAQHTRFKKLVFEIFVTCDEVRKEGRAIVELTPRDQDYTLYFNGVEQATLSELTKELKEDSNAKACCKCFKQQNFSHVNTK